MRHSSTSTKAQRFVHPIDPSTIPHGFTTSATYSGIKAAISPKPAASSSSPSSPPPKPDLALIHSTTAKAPAAAGTFTKNAFKAAPVVLSSKLLVQQGRRARSILINSGCANAVTGKRGMADAEKCVAQVGGLLQEGGVDQGEASTLLLSTGVIGVPLPMDTISKHIPGLVTDVQSPSSSASAAEKWHETARAFMTTDTFPKLRTRTFTLGSSSTTYRMLGIDKGAGMIHPSMSGPKSSGALHATLLGFIATDAPIAPAALQSALEYAVERSFNCISVDGDMSTNDTILALANGAAAEGLKEIEEGSEEYTAFAEELRSFCEELAKLIVRDGEGAEKFVEITVKNAPTRQHAHSIASSISTSALVKCALHGSDANWGRILCAVGYAPLPTNTDGANEAQGWSIDPQKVTVKFLPAKGASQGEELVVLLDGAPQKVDEEAAGRLLQQEDICISVDLQGGQWSGGGAAASAKQATEEATYWTCDFSKEYVAINGDYRT
ncbi:arginine biosynthesis protein ArgJ [Microstroma glucosiphilum]|uniref:Arginine biosynthesis bifunctional protein ArgJ, mitochondrial n=1 Tax=Pseudomicrostroma glucosiphilum TaxID=1684307 RepID=A0A316U593_9BASI|nr:arginine biosynthesis protein ArgJ [Pseudomicrostroma glucosiphilum]PWN18125.1 arginine biosynthesis protein ArgJ [Pseudomicrostroma glucosiphilum]